MLNDSTIELSELKDVIIAGAHSALETLHPGLPWESWVERQGQDTPICWAINDLCSDALVSPDLDLSKRSSVVTAYHAMNAALVLDRLPAVS